ncbi:MAG: cupin domain-containing protein, partial [Pseudorhodoplanes sp.]
MPDRREILTGAALAGAAALSPGQANAQGSTMHQGMTYQDVERLLDLKPNATCGYVRVTYLSEERIAPGGLPAPFESGRPMGSALYFMLTPQQPVKLHRIRNDQFYHYYLGDPIEVLMMLTDGSTQQHIVGPDLRAGHRVQLFIPGNTFHTARV